MEKTYTKKDMYYALINLAEDGTLAYVNKDDEKVQITMDELKEFATHEIELLEKKAEKAKSAVKKKKEDPLMDAVLNAIGEDYETAANIMMRIDCPDFKDEITVAKVQYRLGALVKAGKAEKDDIKIDKRTVKGYRLAPDAE